MKNKLKQENGITLIALIITIIVLLILAGVTISILNGDKGVVQKAADAQNQTGIKATKELVSIDASNYMQDFYKKRYIDMDSSVSQYVNTGAYVAAQFEGQVQYGEYYVKTDIGTTNIKITLDSGGTNVIAQGTIGTDGTIQWTEN